MQFPHIFHRGGLTGYILPCAVLAALSNFPQWLLYQTDITKDGWDPVQFNSTLFSSFRPKVILTEARSSRDHIYLLFANLIFDGLLPTLLFSTLLFGLFFLPGSRAGRLRCRHVQSPYFLTKTPSRIPLPLLFCILLTLLSNLPRHTLDMAEAAQVFDPKNLRSKVTKISFLQSARLSPSLPAHPHPGPFCFPSLPCHLLLHSLLLLSCHR